jgi:hypothetical protein
MKKVQLSFCLLAVLSVFLPLSVGAAELPIWPQARKTMETCYEGWNAVVTVKAGLKSEYVLNDYEDHNVLTIAGEQNIDTSSINTDELDTTASSDSAYDLYESDKAVDAEYSRNRLQNSAYVGVNLTVPLYSREVRLKRKEATNKEIEHLSDLYAQYEGHRATAAALEEEARVLKRIMLENGHQSIQAHYEMLAQKEKSTALMHSAERKIFTILENCGYVERNRIAGAGQPASTAN